MGHKNVSNLKLVLFFTALTFLVTAIVIYAWELSLRPPFFSWVDSRYPGERNVLTRLNIQQRVEHAFISITVDIVVVTLLLRIVRRQQRQLAESEQRYRALFENSGYGIGIITANDHRLLEANSKFCSILGYRQQELLGSDILKILRVPIDLDGTHKTSDLLTLPHSSESELIIETANAEYLPVCMSFNNLVTDTEHLIILVVRDISARKKLETEKEVMQQQLFQTSKLASIGELSAGIAHEINNPLNGVINFAQLLKDDEISLTDFQHQLLDGITEEGHRIEQIVRSLLTFAHRGTNQFQTVNIDEVINTALALFRRQFVNDKIRAEIELDPNLPTIYADSSRLRQVVVNMISNAHQALKEKRTPEGTEKVFRFTARFVERPEGGAVRMEFYDNGVGIRPEHQGSVFDPFYTSRRETGGTGLGLSISFGIIRDHGGTIDVESEVGSFTRFIVELPIMGPPETGHV